MDTVVIKSGDLTFAAAVISSGGLVAVPTETVYGLAANALNANAVARIFEVKGRPSDKPISLLVSGTENADMLCAGIPEDARKLADAFWPGPLTIVLNKRDTVPDIVTAGGGTVGLRCPDHPKTLELISLAGVPLAAPSANISGMPSPKNARAVLSYFDGKIECVIDGGECSVGIESTIIDLTQYPYRILRRGGLPVSEIERVLGQGAAGCI